MDKHHFKKFLVKTIADLIKCALVIAMICFLLWKAPNESSQIIGMASGLIMGPKLLSKLGFNNTKIL